MSKQKIEKYHIMSIERRGVIGSIVFDPDKNQANIILDEAAQYEFEEAFRLLIKMIKERGRFNVEIKEGLKIDNVDSAFVRALAQEMILRMNCIARKDSQDTTS